MRDVTVQQAELNEKRELLTTGEAAKLLSSSRQHVVNLTKSGDLPFVTIGSHRRIRRRDLEALRNRTQRMKLLDQRRSLWLNTAIAGHLVHDPEHVLRRARTNLELMEKRHTRGQAAHWLSEWRTLLWGPTERIMEVLTSPTPWAREMRQNSPFAGVLDEADRVAVLEAFRRTDKAKR